MLPCVSLIPHAPTRCLNPSIESTSKMLSFGFIWRIHCTVMSYYSMYSIVLHHYLVFSGSYSYDPARCCHLWSEIANLRFGEESATVEWYHGRRCSSAFHVSTSITKFKREYNIFILIYFFRASFIAGLTGSVVSNPIDVVKVRH